MANHERGVYEPRDEVRVFDGSEEEDDVEGSRLPLLIVLALLVLAMFAGVVWLAYTQGVARGRGEPPVLAAANGPERVAPQSGGDGTVPYQGFKIYEQPAPSDDTVDAAPAPVAVATPAPKPASPATTPPPAMKQDMITPAATATGAPRSLVAPMAAPTTAAATPTPKPAATAPASSGGVVLQIGAYKSQAAADSAWKTFKAKHSALVSGYSDDIQQADLGEKGTWYRLRIGGISNREVASALCERLRAGGGACILLGR